MKHNHFENGLWFLLLLFMAANVLWAQTNTAEINGRIVDEKGGVVSGANIMVRNVDTGNERTTISSSLGDYVMPSLAPGHYEVAVEYAGFAKVIQKEVTLNVGSKTTLNFTLKPAAVAETVVVSGEVQLLEASKSEISGVVTPVEVQSLPLLNRTFANLSVIMPEARPIGSFDPTKTRVGTVAMNGGDGRQLDVNIDGGDNKDNVVGSLLQNFAYESIQEFQVQQHRWSAESGRAVGGIVNVVSKSGTNEFRGSFFANFRDQALRRKDFFERKNPDDQKAPFNRQELGGSIGGPILRDTLFFFGALEHFRERQINPIRPDARLQLNAVPGVQGLSDIPAPYDDTLLTAKIDHRISGSHSMFYRFSYQDNSSPNDQIPVPPTSDLTNGNSNKNRLYSFVASHTAVISPSKLNVFAYHFQDFSNKILGVTEAPNLVFPTVEVGKNGNVPQATFERKSQFRDDFSWQVNRHSMKFGANYINTRLDGFFFFGAQGYQITFFDDPLTILNNRTLYPQGFATPGAVRQITFSDGQSNQKQKLHQLAFYVQDDFKVSSQLTFNWGLRWDANIGNLIDQTGNRTMLLLGRLNHPLAQAITQDQEKLRRRTPSFREFQPRVGFAYDPVGDGRTVIRGGYGIFFDQLFQNLTLFSLAQTNPQIYQTILDLRNNSVGNGQLATFRFGIDPLPTPPPGTTFTDLAVGGFGRVNDPDAREPYIQKWSIGFQHEIMPGWVVSSDYVHTLGVRESRVQVINPRIRQICDPAFPNAPRPMPLCTRGASARVLDQAFADAGLPRNRIEQINMIGTTNRSRFDSWTTELRTRLRKMTFRAAYVLSSSKAWGGQPVASYSGNPIAIAPENQFKPEEFGPTRIDERHRVVVSGVFDLPWGIQLAPIVQAASARPYSLNTGIDIDGDGLSTIDRICEGTNPRDVFEARGNSARILQLNPLGCRQVQVNSQRRGFITDAQGNVIEERSGRYFNVDLRASKIVKIGERFRISGYADFYNLFNTDNLAFASRRGLSSATSRSGFMQPVFLFGPGFGPPVGRPLTVQLGFRLDF